MKRILIFSLLILTGIPAFALAGFADSMVNADMNLTLIIIVLLLTQLFGYLIIRFCKNKWVRKYKSRIAHWTYWVQKRNWRKWLASWLLPSFIWSAYLSLLPFVLFWIMMETCRDDISKIVSGCIITGGYLLFLAPSISFAVFLFSRKLRLKFLTGRKATATLLSVTCQQIIGYFLFIVTCATPVADLFKKKVNEFEDIEFYIYPTPDGIFLVIENFFFVALLFAIPYILLIIMWTLKWSFNKIKVSISKKQSE